MSARPLLLIVPALALLAGPLHSRELEGWATLAVQEGGRLKPLDTFARETARRVSGARPFTGGESVGGLDAAEWVLSLMAEPGRWKDERMFRVAHAQLREALRLEAHRDRYSFTELLTHQPFLAAVGRVHDKLRQDPEGRLLPLEEEAAGLYDTVSVVAGIFSGDALRVAPGSQDPGARWLSVADLGSAPGDPAEAARAALARLVAAYRSQDRPAASAAAVELRARLAALDPWAYPASDDLAREVRYNRSKPFRWSWLLFLGGALALLCSLPLRARALAGLGLALTLGGFALTTYGLALRVLISGRAPVTNMYESVVYVAWGVVLFALVFEARERPRYVAGCAAALAAVALILADNLPILDGSIQPLVPVLRDNMWLTLHVLTITLGYAAFFLAMGLGHVALASFLLARGDGAEGLARRLSPFLYRALQAGTLLLAAGTLLGGVWASYSWGRFWGWDPKETWALIALLGYLAILHGRFLGWLRDFGMAVGAVVGFLGVLMAWYGVNYVLGTGLHSYGFGSGGLGYAAAFAVFEVLLVGAAWRRHARRAPRSRAVPAAGALTVAGRT
jgi:cytochrome c-type biogenesis protein CcsB